MASLPVMKKSVSAAIERVNPRLAFSFQPLPAIVSRSILLEKALAIGSVMFGAIATLLAAVGLYGVTGYAVSRRRQEIGIQMALGADPHRIVRLVFQRVSYMVLPGILAGAAASLWLSRFVAPLLYGLDPHDLRTLLSAVGARGSECSRRLAAGASRFHSRSGQGAEKRLTPAKPSGYRYCGRTVSDDY